MRKANPLLSFAYGVELVTGLPGAGKSFVMMLDVLRAIKDERRPVFTNLPIRWRVLKWYLRIVGGVDGPKLAGLAHPLTEGHMRRYLQRVSAYQRERIDAIAEASRKGQRFSHDFFEWSFFQRHGPHVCRATSPQADDANWILPTAFIVIDEVHHWFPADTVGGTTEKRVEPRELLSYLTMLRHHVHRLVVISQSDNQVSVRIRRLVARVTRVVDAGDEKFLWNIRFKSIGVRVIRAETFVAGTEDSKNPDLAGALSVKLYFPRLPFYGYVFRLYDSYTHCGSPRRMLNRLRQARIDAGLTKAGYMEQEAERQAKRAKQAREDARMSRRLIRWSKRLVFVMIFGGAVALGAGLSQKEAGASGPASVAAEPPKWMEITGYGRNQARLGTNVVRVGEVGPNGILLAVDGRSRRALWLRDDAVWRQDRGPFGYRLASASDYAGLVREALYRSGSGASVDVDASVSPGSVGLAEGDD